MNITRNVHLLFRLDAIPFEVAGEVISTAASVASMHRPNVCCMSPVRIAFCHDSGYMNAAVCVRVPDSVLTDPLYQTCLSRKSMPLHSLRSPHYRSVVHADGSVVLNLLGYRLP